MKPLAGLRVGMFGLGEAGSEIAGGLAAHGATVTGYDPKPVDPVDGAELVSEPAAAVAGVDLVIAVTAAGDSPTALEQAFDELPSGSVYADLATSAPARKRELAARAAARVSFVDVALMTTAPGNGMMIPSLACGPGAAQYADMLAPARPPIEVVSDTVGEAATRKLLRSVAIKGLAGVVIEALDAAEAAGRRDETWANLAEQFSAIDEGFLRRLVAGTPQHAERRFHEMEAAEQLLIELGVDAVMTRATVEHLDRLR